MCARKHMERLVVIFSCRDSSWGKDYKSWFPRARWHKRLCNEVHAEEILVSRNFLTCPPLFLPNISKRLGKGGPRNSWCRLGKNSLIPCKFKGFETHADTNFSQRRITELRVPGIA